MPDALAVKRTLLSLIIILLVTSAVRCPLLNIPFERDEGEYAYIAWRMDYNEVPYRDVFDQKPPGVFWIYRLALALPMDSVRAVHLTAMMVSAATAMALFFLARLFVGEFWAAVAACLFAVLSADPLAEGTAANTELFMLLPLVLSQLTFFSALPGERRVFPRTIPFMMLCGIFTGMAIACKQVAFFNWPALIVIYPFFLDARKRWSQALWFAIYSTLGVVLVWGAIALYFVSKNALGQFVYNVFTHNLEYITAIPWKNRLQMLSDTLGHLAHSEALIWLCAILGLGALCRSRRWKLLLFLAAWISTSVMGISASGFYFPHYFQQIFPALALAAALGAAELDAVPFLNWISIVNRRIFIGLALFVLPVIVLLPFLVTYTPDEAVRKIYPPSFFGPMREFGAELAKRTSPSDKVFVFGAEPEVLFYARRASATRYIFLFPLYGPYRDAHEKQMATAEEIARNHPAAILYTPNGLFFNAGTDQYLTEWTKAYVHRSFRPATGFMMNEQDQPEMVSADPSGALPPATYYGILCMRKEK